MLWALFQVPHLQEPPFWPPAKAEAERRQTGWGAPPTRCPSAWPWGLTPTPSSIWGPLQCETYSLGGVQARAPRNILSLSPSPLFLRWQLESIRIILKLRVFPVLIGKRRVEKSLFSSSPPSKLTRNRHSRVQELPATFLLPVLGGTAASWFKSGLGGASAHLSGYFPARLTLRLKEESVRCCPKGSVHRQVASQVLGRREETEPGQD